MIPPRGWIILTTDIALDEGQMTFSNMQGSSAVLSLTGEGQMDLVKEQTDTRFNVRVLQGLAGRRGVG